MSKDTAVPAWFLVSGSGSRVSGNLLLGTNEDFFEHSK